MTWSPVSVGDPRPVGKRGKGGRQGRQATGRKAIPAGVLAGVQAAALEGGRTQAEIAKDFGVSRWLVARLAGSVKGIDPDQVSAIKRGLPSMLTVLAGAHTAKALEAVEAGDAGAATKYTFGAKLATEANRWAQPAADNPGATLLAFIDALHQAGGGRLAVEVNGPPASEAVPEPAPEADLTALALTEERP